MVASAVPEGAARVASTGAGRVPLDGVPPEALAALRPAAAAGNFCARGGWPSEGISSRNFCPHLPHFGENRPGLGSLIRIGCWQCGHCSDMDRSLRAASRWALRRVLSDGTHDAPRGRPAAGEPSAGNCGLSDDSRRAETTRPGPATHTIFQRSPGTSGRGDSPPPQAGRSVGRILSPDERDRRPTNTVPTGAT